MLLRLLLGVKRFVVMRFEVWVVTEKRHFGLLLQGSVNRNFQCLSNSVGKIPRLNTVMNGAQLSQSGFKLSRGRRGQMEPSSATSVDATNFPCFNERLSRSADNVRFGSLVKWAGVGYFVFKGPRIGNSVSAKNIVKASLAELNPFFFSHTEAGRVNSRRRFPVIMGGPLGDL